MNPIALQCLTQPVCWMICRGDCLVETAHFVMAGYFECAECQNRIYVHAVETTGQDQDR